MQGGRLAQLKTGYNTVSDSLQDMRYTYDLAGNVLTISDYKAGGIQTQTFEYDDLNRLRSAVASGGTGGTYALQNYSYDTNGRLASNAGVTYSYNNPAHVHAVTGTSDGRSYGYDANGNQTTRTVGGQTYTLSYDAESRMVGVSGPVSATFVYDGDGNRVTSTIGTTNTVYINGYFEWSGSLSTMRRYYYAGDQRIAMRLGTTTLRFLLGDHLGSTAITATTSGSKLAELRYYPWGGVRYTYGTTPTDYRFTGQQELSSIGLYDYGARFYDPALGRFVSPDTIIPQQQGTQAWDRYAYVNNSPAMYTDPTGHWSCGDQYDPACAETIEEEYQYYLLTNPLPSGMVLPPELPTGVSDMHLLDAFVYLWNTPTGRAFAQTILDANVTLTWGREGQKSQTWESGYMDGSGVLHTDIVVSLNIDNYWHPAAAARDLAHEGVHVHRNDHRDSIWEEYTAFRIESVVSAELNDRYGANLISRFQFSSNPRPSATYLDEWFDYYHFRDYYDYYGGLPTYP